jgi:hypothetical protein
VLSSSEERERSVDLEKEGTNFLKNLGKPIVYHLDAVW